MRGIVRGNKSDEEIKFNREKDKNWKQIYQPSFTKNLQYWEISITKKNLS